LTLYRASAYHHALATAHSPLDWAHHIDLQEEA